MLPYFYLSAKCLDRKWRTMTNGVFGRQKSQVLLWCDVFSWMSKKGREYGRCRSCCLIHSTFVWIWISSHISICCHNVRIWNDRHWQMKFLKGRKVRSCCDVTFFHDEYERTRVCSLSLLLSDSQYLCMDLNIKSWFYLLSKHLDIKWQIMTYKVSGKQKSQVLL